MDNVLLLKETGSTNADLRALAADWPEGRWLRAERQSAGRGRLGRDWASPEGNLHASTLIRLRPNDPPVTALGLLVGIAVVDALKAFHPEGAFQLKWPNDVMVGTAKLAGILLERQGDAVIVGVGINIASAPALPDRMTICVADLVPVSPDAAGMILEHLMSSLALWLTAWRKQGTAAIIRAWLVRSHPLGTRLSISTGSDQSQQGRFMGLNADGALILALDNGTSEIFHSGDVGILI